jgi:hypothetical protein
MKFDTQTEKHMPLSKTLNRVSTVFSNMAAAAAAAAVLKSNEIL